jgi:hypothetical protein
MAYLEEVLADPSLQDFFELYAYKEFLHLPGKEPERIITGYMSANDAFEVEVCHAICTRTLLTSLQADLPQPSLSIEQLACADMKKSSMESS